MGSKLRLVRSTNQSRRFRFLLLIVGCFIVTVTFLVVSKPQALVSNLGFGTSASTSPPVADGVSSDDDGVNGADSAAVRREEEDDERGHESESNNEKEENLSGEKNIVVDANPKEEVHEHELTESRTESEEHSAKSDDPGSSQDDAPGRLTLPTVSNYSIGDHTQPESNTPIVSEKLGEQIQTPERKPLCDNSDRRADICEMNGDIRIHGSTSSVLFVESLKIEQSEAWQIHPYARKGDQACFNEVRELMVKASNEAPQCTTNYDVPSIVFSIGGYAGNLFHDFADLLVPLFLTARQFNGEVQFVVTNLKSWWITKFNPVLQKLSKYPVINFDLGNDVHCFKQAIVGLRAHNEFQIDPARAPNGYTMVDFAKFMRSAFSVGRETVPNIEDLSARKPRLLIISRKQSRIFTNINEIVATAEEMGYEVVVNEADVSSGISQFAEIVNSCDVMVGVYGSGLTNSVFLPQNATLIQVVPWGGLEWMASNSYGEPAKQMGLNYVQYSVGIEESSLLEQYPKDHAVFTDPASIHIRGFQEMRSTFLEKQNVKLDINKFRDVLWKTLEQLIQ
ncbi:alpha-1,3-arabinosyltransferase XAT2-like [Zingiber officinale]|nr:alpha-1,3-arabinosyltransferase XAT2-like [Zingiber officinale]